MTQENSLRVIQNVPPVTSYNGRYQHTLLDTDDYSDHGQIQCCISHLTEKWNNLALGTLLFSHSPSSLISTDAKSAPRLGDLCVKLNHLTSSSDKYSSAIDLYNTYVVTGCSTIAKRRIDCYVGTEELDISAIPIHTFVSEWNNSLMRFHDMVIHEGEHQNQGPVDEATHAQILTNIVEHALKNVPILRDHLWFLVHAIVSGPHLLKQALQVVGTVASTSGKQYFTGPVERVTIPRNDATYVEKLYLVTKSAPNRHRLFPLNCSGATLALTWATSEDHLFDYLQNSGACYYLHLGTQTGSLFLCNRVCDWRYYNGTVFTRMISLSTEVTCRITDSSRLAGNTGDSARVLQVL